MFIRQSSDIQISQLPDQLLISKYRETGQHAFFSELYSRYVHLVFGNCLNHLKDRDDYPELYEFMYTNGFRLISEPAIDGFGNIIKRGRYTLVDDLRNVFKNGSHDNNEDYFMFSFFIIDGDFYLNESDIETRKSMGEYDFYNFLREWYARVTSKK